MTGGKEQDENGRMYKGIGTSALEGLYPGVPAAALKKDAGREVYGKTSADDMMEIQGNNPERDIF